MTLQDLIRELERLRATQFGTVARPGVDVKVMLIDYTDDMTPVEVDLDRVELVAGWRLILYPSDLPR